MKSARGFTLLEIIVVIAIFGVMAVMAYGGLASVLHSRQRVAVALDRTAELQRAYMRLREDFQQVSNRPARNNYGDIGPAFLGSRDNQVLFTHGGWRNPLLLPRASLERVLYRLDEKTGTLIRSSYRVLDLAQDSKPVEVPLLSEVDDLHWRYFDTATQEWRTTWPADTLSNDPATLAAIAPPLAVELTLETKDLGELKFLFKLGLDPLPNGFTGGQILTGTNSATTTTTTATTTPTGATP